MTNGTSRVTWTATGRSSGRSPCPYRSLFDRKIMSGYWEGGKRRTTARNIGEVGGRAACCGAVQVRRGMQEKNNAPSCWRGPRGRLVATRDWHKTTPEAIFACARDLERDERRRSASECGYKQITCVTSSTTAKPRQGATLPSPCSL